MATSDLEARVNDLERRMDRFESAGRSPAPRDAARPPSPREFLLSKSGATTLNDKVLLAGYYIENYEGKESFDYDDLTRFLAAAKESAPKNIRDAVFQNVKRGSFREVGERVRASTARNKWALANPGIARVEIELSGRDETGKADR
jgi:hypothetical protein